MEIEDYNCVIYKITSPSQRIYIGQSRDFEDRQRHYLKLKCSNQPRLYNSLVKYGVENHRFEIVENCKFFEMNKQERYWQDYYEVLSRKGLNCILTETEELPRIYHQSVLDNMRKAQLLKDTSGENNPNWGNTWNDEQRKIASDRMHSPEYSRVGIKSSFETCMKISIAKMGYSHKPETIEKMKKVEKPKGADSPVAKAVFDTLFRKLYWCVEDAAIVFGIKPSTLASYLSGARRNPTTLVYLENYVDGSGVKEPEQLLKESSIEVIDTLTLTIFPSITEAGRFFGIDGRSLNRYLNGLIANKTTLMIFKNYMDGMEPLVPEESRQKIKVMNTDTKVEFESKREAAKSINLKHTTFIQKMNKGTIPFVLSSAYDKNTDYKVKVITRGKKVIDIATITLYTNLKLAAEAYGINYSTIRSYLNPNCKKKNTTTLEFYIPELHAHLVKN